MYATPEAPVAPGYGGYYDLPKDVGDVSAAELLEVADFTAGRADTLPDGAATRHHAVAGSAYVEAALVEAAGDHDVDETLALLDDGETHLRQAARGEYQFLETGFHNPDDQDDWLRAELQCDFVTVYRDIVCGEITTQTCAEITKILREKLAYVERLMTLARGNGRGVAYELRVLLSFWEAYREEGDMVAFPSTIRGGDGQTRHRETHDVTLAYQEGTKWHYSGAEIKGGNGLTPTSLARYDHPIIHVTHGGEIHTY